MRKNFLRIATIAFVAIMAVGFIPPAAPAAVAQSEGDIKIVFAGNEVSGPEDVIASLMLGAVRPMVATADLNKVTDTNALAPFAPTAGCFGVTERKSDWRLLKETRFMTDLSNGRYEAVVPGDNEHGDWPPHGILFQLQSSEPLACNELVADISYRMLFVPSQATTLVYTFKLNPEQKDAYAALASQGDLGLFVSSETPVEVNLELLAGRACHDCLAHTAAVTDTIGAGVYSPGTVEWFGELTEGDDVAFDEMYVLPLPEKYDQEWNLVINAPANSVVWIWFGRFDIE